MGKVFVKSGVTPRLLIIFAGVSNVARELPWDVTITAGTDGKHMKGSKHYSGEALDIRSKNFPTKRSKQDFVSAVLLRLGPGYEMFLEQEGKPNEHFHCEWDPRCKSGKGRK